MKNKAWKKNDKGWMMNDDDFKLLRGFDDGQTDNICECRVAFATENVAKSQKWGSPFGQLNN